MNKQSNLYTAIYIVVLVLIAGTALSVTSLMLRQRQYDNERADKMRQILAAVHIVPEKGQTIADFDKYIVEQQITNAAGAVEQGDALRVDVATQSKEAADKRELPVYVCRLDDGQMKYILPVYGAGLWGPIWGYVAFDADGSRIYGAYFAHQGETPGLGAEIEKPAFCDQFEGKQVIKDGEFMPVTVVKAGQHPTGNEDYVDGVSGGTITSKGVGAMLDNCLVPYESYLKQLSNK